MKTLTIGLFLAISPLAFGQCSMTITTTSGTLCVPLQTSIGPVTVTGTPNLGDIVTATGPTTAAWMAPAGNSGGAGVPWFAATFVPPVPSDWSALGGGCATGTVTGVTGAPALQVVGSVGPQNTCGLKVSVPAGDFTHIFTIYTVISAPHFSTAAVGFTDGTKMEYCGVGSGSDQNIDAGTTTQAKGPTLTGPLSGANGISAYYLPFANMSGPNFFRLKRTGNNLSCDYSPDGVNFINQFNDTASFMTANALYVGVDPRGSSVASLVLLESYQ